MTITVTSVHTAWEDGEEIFSVTKVPEGKIQISQLTHNGTVRNMITLSLEEYVILSDYISKLVE